jgi:hypothetical protein
MSAGRMPPSPRFGSAKTMGDATKWHASFPCCGKVRLRLASCYPRRPLFLEISSPKTSAREKSNLDGNLRSLIGQQGRQESSIHAGVINKQRQDSKRTVTSGSLCVTTGPVEQRAGPGVEAHRRGQTNVLHLNTRHQSRATIMPPMTIEEAIETTKIHSICALLNDNNSFCTPGPSALPIIRFPTWGCFGARRIRAPMK